MSTRIRYRKTSDVTVLESVQRFQHPTNGARYKVNLKQTENEFFVFEELSNTVVASGRATNLHQMKIKAKAALQKLGISFSTEERDID